MMELSNKSARELFREVQADPKRPRLGFGRKPVLINVDLQNAYTRPAEFVTAYETDPRQIEHVNALARLCRRHGLPDTPDSLQNIKADSRRAALDDRCEVDRTRDIVIHKRMASAFFETNLASLLTWHRVDTVIVTGGSTSGCVRATVLDAFSLNYRIALAEEGCFDRSQASHAINLCDMNAKYADVVKTAEVLEFFDKLPSGMFDLPKGTAAAAPKPKLAANF